ncbi:helix-turn-helix domain-containing protein [Mycobacterium sp. TJFP1]
MAVELCEYASQDRSVVWPSVAVLAEDSELDRSSVIRALNQLAAAGFIVCDGGRKGGRGCSTRWRLVIKGGADATLYDTERVAPESKRVAPVHKKGRTSATRSSKEEGEEEAAADAAHTPPLVSLNGEPRGCCPEHEPPGVEGCDGCLRAWSKHEVWEAQHPRSWAEFAAEMMPTFREDWVADGPPRFCERDHPVGAPCGTCGELRVLRKEWDQRHAQWEEDRADRREDIDGCRLCDRVGRVWVGEDPDPWWCDHGWGVIAVPLSSFGPLSSVPPDPQQSEGRLNQVG